MNIRSITTLLIISLLVIPILVVGCGGDGDDDDTGPTGGAKKVECITCEGTLNGTRWCDQGDGTVKDMTTGLVWLQDAFWGSIHPFWVDTMDGTNAHDRASQVRDGNPSGLYDRSIEGEWRLPTKEELYGLVNGTEAIRCTSGTCDVYGFTGVVANVFWSSTTSALDPNKAWAVETNTGLRKEGNKANNAMVWPVRCD